MTYHPVTREELDMIQNQNHYWKQRTIDTVLARPDPLEVLEKWAWFTKDNLDYGYYEDTVYISEMQKFIQEYRTNPDAVIARGKEEGWLE